MIITTAPNELMRPIHNRMPVILDQSAFERWPDRNNKAADVADLLRPHEAEKMKPGRSAVA
jgi:putative SOS response-associated peptidase YedK